ncbi:hypothetical protein KC968_04275 [Candidatus Saccharibacteria bacterium]|nr:hypothetical protein [Candidatus Saccharibacteria bacterium]
MSNANSSVKITDLKESALGSLDHLYSVEYFHIYTDEIINDSHKASLNYLREALKAWKINHELIVLIDNYNPENHILSEDDIFDYLNGEGFSPDFFAFEADMVEVAESLVNSLSDKRLKKNYTRYIKDKQKYPCSLLTASWYLMRLGKYPHARKIRSTKHKAFKNADRLINILPLDYKEVETRARKIVLSSEWPEAANMIQNLYYPAGSHRKIDLF